MRKAGCGMARGQFRMPRTGLAGVEAVAAASGHAFCRHTHDRFGIGVIDRGAQRSLSGRGTVEAGPGDVITVNPGEVHDGAPIGGAGRSWRILYLDPGLVLDAMAEVTGDRAGAGELVHPVVHRPDLARRVGRLFELATGGPGGGTALQRDGLLLEVLAALVDRRPDGGHGKPGVPASVRHACRLIDDDPAAPLTLEDLARAGGLGRFQLLRAFSRATGLTPHAYLVQRRVDAARRLIAGGVPLAEAALASGFCDQSHLTRVFTRKYGITPGAYAAAVA